MAPPPRKRSAQDDDHPESSGHDAVSDDFDDLIDAQDYEGDEYGEEEVRDDAADVGELSEAAAEIDLDGEEDDVQGIPSSQPLGGLTSDQRGGGIQKSDDPATMLSSVPDVYEPMEEVGGGGSDSLLTEMETSGLTLSEIVLIDAYRHRIAQDYYRFLTTFTDESGHSVYHARIRAMCAANRESLEVSYLHLMESNAFLAKLVANVPTDTLAIFDAATMRIVLRLFENYKQIKTDIHVRITDFPAMDSLRDLRHQHLNTLIRTSGVVTRRSGVFPQLQAVKYDCKRCGQIIGPFLGDTNTEGELKVQSCPACQSNGPFTVNTAQTVYRNYQKVTLQEAPGTVPAGRLPRHKEVILLWDLIDGVRPGELVQVTGVFRNNYSHSLSTKNAFPVFATVIEANHVGKLDGGEWLAGGEARLTEEDERAVRKLAEDPLIAGRIVSSIAPSIYGHRDIKTAIALALFAGQPKNAQGKHPIRGDINVLLLGDPGTAKSQFLKYVEKTAHRAVFTTGQGASAVGLTASVRKDPVTREWTLEGGALVLADRGVCCIDEFDKMNDADRTSIHEAMEQQSISISKAGIVTTLQARCAIIAAANPIRGRYNSALPFSQNVLLTEPILSRFDILCVVRDIVDPVNDEQLAKFVVSSHSRSLRLAKLDSSEGESTTMEQDTSTWSPVEPIPQDLLKKYLLYAKTRIRPELSQMDVDKIARVYAELRRESLSSGSLPITVRHLESIVRMAEAHARIHLRPHVRSDDIDLAIRVMLESFMQAQKHSVMNHLKKSFAKYISYKRDSNELLYYLLNDLLRDSLKYQASRLADSAAVKTITIAIHDLQQKAREVNVHDLRPFFASRLFTANGFRVIEAAGCIEKDL